MQIKTFLPEAVEARLMSYSPFREPALRRHSGLVGGQSGLPIDGCDMFFQNPCGVLHIRRTQQFLTQQVIAGEFA